MATITVTTTADNGKGSLRSAIAQANSGDTIRFSKTLADKTIGLSSGQLSLTKDLTIDGAGASGLTISGNFKTRVFQLEKRKRATIRNLTIANGKTKGAGGGIDTRHESTLVLENVTVKNNKSELGGGVRVGHLAKATVLNSRFTGNDGTLSTKYAGFSAGAISHQESRGQLIVKGTTFENNRGFNGGAIYSLGSVRFIVEDSTFRNNTAKSKAGGGAIFTDGVSSKGYSGPINDGKITIRRSRFEGNQADGKGGALFLWGYGKDKAIIEDSVIADNKVLRNAQNSSKGGAIWAKIGLDVRNVTFANNTAIQQGGALWLESNQPANIVNSTFSANRVLSDAGGAMFLKNGTTPINITNSTIAYNSAGRANGAIWLSKNHNVTLKNSIVAFNRAESDRKQDQVGYAPKDGGGNLEFTTNSRANRISSKSIFADPRLLPLKSENGMLVHALKLDSPAIDAGVNSGVPSLDQRGAERDNKVDIGAFEVTTNAPPITQPTTDPIPTTPSPTPNPSPIPPSPTSDNKSLVAHLSLNEVRGTTAFDISPSGQRNSGTLFGNPKWASGKQKGGLRFDGVGDTLKIKNSEDINLGIQDERTVSLWFKADKVAANAPRQILYEEGGSGRGLNIYLDKNRLYVGGWNTSQKESGWQGTYLNTDKVSAGRWHHVDLVLDGGQKTTAGALRGYLDGKEFGRGRGSQLWEHRGSIGIGNINGTTRFHDGITSDSNLGFSGTVDEVKIFNSALSGSDINNFVL